jgi:hypothetical protein
MSYWSPVAFNGKNEVQVYPGNNPAATIANAVANSTVANPWTVRFMAGIHDLSATLSVASAQGVRIVGDGKHNTIIRRTVSVANSVPGGRGTDPVIDFTSSIACGLQDVTVQHTAAQAGVGSSAGIVINEAIGFRAINCRIEATYIGIDAENATYPATNDDDNENRFTDCDIVVLGNSASSASDTLYISKQDIRLINTNTLMEHTISGADTFFVNAARLVILGGEHIRRFLGTGGNGRCLVISPSTANLSRTYALGARFYLDATTATFNSGTPDVMAINVSTSTSNTGDWELDLVGCRVEYESGTITGGRFIGGLSIDTPGTNGTLGNTRLVGTAFRDLGGTGATTRADVQVLGTVSSGTKISKDLFQQGSQIRSMNFRAVIGTPVITGNYGKTENTINFQTSTATFATAATVAVTLPIAFPVFGANTITDYAVDIEQPNGTEIYWVTAKTSTGFTLNSSNVASTATVRWSIVR